MTAKHWAQGMTKLEADLTAENRRLREAARAVVSEFEDIKHGETIHVGSLVIIDRLKEALNNSESKGKP